MELRVDQVERICSYAPAARVAAMLPHLHASLAVADISTPLRASMYLAQIGHETRDLTRFDEDLNYRAETICKVWQHRFPTLEAAAPYAHNPEKLANAVYADRLGNGDRQSGDGYRFRGRGALMNTGAESYLRLSRETGIDFMAHPELLAEPEYAFLGAAKVWTWKGLNRFADKGDLEACTHAIQGALEGLEERWRRFDLGCEAFGALSLHTPARGS